MLVGAVILVGCGSSSSVSSTTTSAPHFDGTALSWLTSELRPFNRTLNNDQAAVDAASATTSESDASAFFGRLAGACTRLRDDARRAGNVASAPDPSLETAWQAMVTNTANYAEDCLALTRTKSNAALTRWDDSIKTMNSANGALNAAVAAVRSGTAGATG